LQVVPREDREMRTRLTGNAKPQVARVEGDRCVDIVHDVPEEQLLLFIGEAREGFKERFGGERAQ
jgi:hypothetical protein